LNFQEAGFIGVVFIGTANMGPKPMPLDKEVLGPIGDTLASGELPSCTVVLESTTMKSGTKRGTETNGLRDFNEKITKRQQCAKT
jgi:hypothetical protein